MVEISNMTRPDVETQPGLEMQDPAKKKVSWSRINKRQKELVRKAKSWLGHHGLRPLPRRNKQSRLSKPPLESFSSSNTSGNDDADVQCRANPAEPDILDAHAAVDAVAGDEDPEVLLRTLCEAYSILVTFLESQGHTVDDLTGDEVEQAVVELYYWCIAPQDRGNGSSDAGGPTGGISSSSVFSPASHTAPSDSRSQSRGLKRARSEDSDNGDGSHGRGPGPSSRKHGPESNSQWLCPFYLFDPEAHRQCLRFKLSRIVDVRSHILRKHRQVSHCPICGEKFPDDPTGTNRSNHVLTCSAPQAVFHHPGATPDQYAKVAARARDRTSNRTHGGKGRATHTDKDEWFCIWDVLFPGTAHPPCPYALYSDVVQIMLDASRRFLEHGPAEEIVNDFLPGDAPLDQRAQLLENIKAIVNRFVSFANESEIHNSRAVNTSQSRSHVPGRRELQVPTHSQQSQQPPSLAGSSLATYADSNILYEPGPAAVQQAGQPLLAPQIPKLLGSDQPLLPAWPTVAYNEPRRGLAALPVDPHEAGDADADAEDDLADFVNEDYMPGAL